jgi:hypothetical protein
LFPFLVKKNSSAQKETNISLARLTRYEGNTLISNDGIPFANEYPAFGENFLTLRTSESLEEPGMLMQTAWKQFHAVNVLAPCNSSFLAYKRASVRQLETPD